MKVLHTVAGLWEGTGGPAASIPSLCSGLAEKGHEVTLLTGAGALNATVERLRPRVRVRTEPLGPYALAHWSPRFRAACLEESATVDIVHDHGVWLHTNWSSVWAATRARRPIVRSPRGMLSPWALRRSRLVKGIVWILAERTLFRRAALVHVTSEAERRDVERLGIETPVIVIPNGIDVESEFALHRVTEARHRGLPEAEGRRVVLFLSRVHPVKGLSLLCQAWAGLPADSPALLLLAGPGDRRSLASLHRWLAEQPGPPARYLASAVGDRKLALLSSAWLLVLPSLSESYGMAVAEALACGTPVVTTTETPWSDVTAAGCGWVVPPQVDSLRRALADGLRLSPSEHAQHREKARALVARHHSLGNAIARMDEAYRALVDCRSRA